MVDEQEPTPEELERQARLFEHLAAEEPPLDLHNDTAPSKTAPRSAVNGENTRPFKLRDGRRYVVTLALGVVLMVSLVVTVLVFLGGDDAKPQPIAEANTPTVIVEASQSATPTQAPSAAPTDEVAATPTPTSAVSQFMVDLPPTAAVDEVGTWLLTPVALSTSGTVGDGSVVRQDNPITVSGSSSRLEVITYTVQQGDTLTEIADRFDLDLCTLVWSNPRNRVSPLRPGYVLDIMPTDGVFYKVDRPVTIQEVADITVVSPYAIIDSPYNSLFGAVPQTVLSEGMKIVVPGGQLPNCNIWAPPKSASGSGSSSGGGGGLWGCDYGGGAGSYPASIPIGGRYNFFQGFSAAHTGVDLAAPTGTPVLAAGAGVVAFAGWNDWGYGNAIVIDHGGSYSLYGHLSAITVVCGQAVGAGEAIGAVGSTGRSSGPHLHFEIRDGGFNPVDPTLSMAL